MVTICLRLELASDILEIESRIKKSKNQTDDFGADQDNVREESSKKSTVTPHNTPVVTMLSNSHAAKKNIIVQNGSQKISLLADGEIDKFKNIDEIVDSFITVFKDFTKERVLD